MAQTPTHLHVLTLASLLALLGCQGEMPSTPDTHGGSSGNGGSGGTSSAGSAGAVSNGGSVGAGGASGGSAGASVGGSAGHAGGSGGVGVSGASGAGGFGGSGGSGGTVFEPCPATDSCKILPLGDSITDGFETPGGYRIRLFELAVADGKQITFVGGSMNGPQTVADQPFPRSHEGHSGWTISRIDDIVPAPALGVDPHIILFHIGTNDIFQMQAVSEAPDRLAAVMDQILAELPDALLVVAQIVPLSGFDEAIETFNAAIPPLVQERANAGKHVILVDQFTGFPLDELDDGVHPDPDGYSRMASTWYAAISSYLR